MAQGPREAARTSSSPARAFRFRAGAGRCAASMRPLRPTRSRGPHRCPSRSGSVRGARGISRRWRSCTIPGKATGPSGSAGRFRSPASGARPTAGCRDTRTPSSQIRFRCPAQRTWSQTRGRIASKETGSCAATARAWRLHSRASSDSPTASPARSGGRVARATTPSPRSARPPPRGSRIPMIRDGSPNGVWRRRSTSSAM